MERAFRLAGLLRLRELQEDQAAARLAASHAGLRAAELRRETTRTALGEQVLPAHTDPLGWRRSVATRTALTHLLSDAAVEVADAGLRVGADTAEWSAARLRSVGLEKLRDAHRSAVAAEDGRAEQLVLDEIASRGGRADLPAPGGTRPSGTRPSVARPSATSPRTAR